MEAGQGRNHIGAPQNTYGFRRIPSASWHRTAHPADYNKHRRFASASFSVSYCFVVEAAGLGRLGCFSFIHIIRVHLLTSNPFSFNKNVEIRQLRVRPIGRLRLNFLQAARYARHAHSACLFCILCPIFYNIFIVFFLWYSVLSYLLFNDKSFAHVLCDIQSSSIYYI